MPTPPNLLLFQKACLDLPDERFEYVSPPFLQPTIDVFTDGGCLAPASQLARLASWGVVVGDPVTTDFFPVACGLVKGWSQTALRGEITAAIGAIQFAIHHHSAVR